MFRRAFLLGISFLIFIIPIAIHAAPISVSLLLYDKAGTRLISTNEVAAQTNQDQDFEWNEGVTFSVFADKSISMYQLDDPSITKSRARIHIADNGTVSIIGTTEYSRNGTPVQTVNGLPAPAAQSPGGSAAQTGNGAATGAVIKAPTGTPAPVAAVAKCGDSKGIIDPKCDLKQNLEHLYNISVPIIVLLAFLAVIYAGYIYITSFGQAERITEAKNWLLAAVGGIVLILLVPVILSFLKTVPLPGQ